METLKKLLWISAILMLVSSCSKEEMVEKTMEIPEGKILVNTEVVVDGIVQTNTRASSEAGYTTGDGLYDTGDQVTVAAIANDGYELVTFYDKNEPATNLGTSYTFPARIPQTFKAEFAKKYTITVSASPTAGGTVSGGGKYRSGKTCTLTATANAGYVFDGWYEGSTKLSSNTSYSFTVSSNRTITGKFGDIIYTFRPNNPTLGTVNKDRIILSDYRDIDSEGDEINVTPTPIGNGRFVKWVYETSNGTVGDVRKSNVTSDNRLYIDNSQYLESYYPAGTEFRAVFEDSGGSGDDTQYYTVTFKIAEWRNGSWSNSQPLPYCLSWTQTWNTTGPTTLTKSFKKGETCTIYWAASGYEARAITDSNHNIIQSVLGKSSYSFKVTQNITHYVDMVELQPN